MIVNTMQLITCILQFSRLSDIALYTFSLVPKYIGGTFKKFLFTKILPSHLFLDVTYHLPFDMKIAIEYWPKR